MKTKVLVLFALVLSANLRAQVTIGALTAPAAGALLDLNRGTPGGLLLSNVQIENLSKIPHSAPGLFPGIDGTNDDTNTALTGAVVYHIGENNIPAGLYVWNGTNWTPITENCLPADLLSVTLTSSTVLAKTGDPVTFSVASSASERCAGSETYYWYQATATDDYGAVSATTVYPESSKSIVFSSAGTYKVQVEVSNIYSASAKATSNEVTVYVTNDGKVTPEMLNHSYGIVGETCLDVMKPNAGQAPTVYAARKPGFPGGNYEKTYKFVHQSEYFDLSLSCDDSANIVEAITVYPPKLAFADGTAVDGYYEKEFKIKFKSNIRDLVPANGNSLTVKLTASYRDSNNEPKLAYLEIRVEDGTCVCPAKTESNKWKNFMCHNLGGLDIISSSQLITRAHHGDWYRFGADTVSM
ncbi:MAG: hypothetical protein LBP72_04115, partial [Dysgonamonadaceae bacterium]|nr:hypothetical protein [Dysgonamonadaceae bacterium]